jgi:hypothetical protein
MKVNPKPEIPQNQIRQILLSDWDPHDAARNQDASGAYDTYIEPLWSMIQAGADEEQVMEWLHEREQESMCFPSLGIQRLRRAAKKLVALRRDT